MQRRMQPAHDVHSGHPAFSAARAFATISAVEKLEAVGVAVSCERRRKTGSFKMQ